MLTTLPDHVMFMKVGNHAHETFEQILTRKRAEGLRAGRIFWGYGGTACHPLTQVQPFAKRFVERGETIFLAMEYIDSKANPDVADATQYSSDGRNWQPLPDGVKVTGSRYALVMEEIIPGELILPPGKYEVAIGPSAGKVASEYLQGRTDKACLTRRLDSSKQATTIKPATMRARDRNIHFLAKLAEPYAVLVR